MNKLIKNILYLKQTKLQNYLTKTYLWLYLRVSSLQIAIQTILSHATVHRWFVVTNSATEMVRNPGKKFSFYLYLVEVTEFYPNIVKEV